MARPFKKTFIATSISLVVWLCPCVGGGGGGGGRGQDGGGCHYTRGGGGGCQYTRGGGGSCQYNQNLKEPTHTI